MKGSPPHPKNPPEKSKPHKDTYTGMDNELRRRWFIRILGCGCLIFWLFSIYNLTTDDTLPLYIPLFFAGLTTFWIILISVFRRAGFLVWSSRLFTLSLMALLSYYMILGGENNTRALWSNTIPLIAIFMLGIREGGIWTGLFLAAQIVIVFHPALPLNGPAYETPFTLRYFLSLSLVIFMTWCFETGRLRVQKNLRRNQQLLKASEKRLRDAFEDLKTAQSQLVQSGKLASIGQLASGVAHELNQPLMVIRGNAQLVERQLANEQQDQPQDVSSFLTVIERNTKRMTTIINHLRNFSRQSQADFVPVDINAVIRDTFLMIGEQLRIRGVEVTKNFSTDLPRVSGDANQLEQVFLNLISNAADALESQSWSASDPAMTKRLAITTRSAHDGVPGIEILFKDNGCGIPADHLATIFDPFFTTKETGKGTGLGLSISYSIVKKHDGTIEVINTGQRGTVFRVMLPAAGGECLDKKPQKHAHLAKPEENPQEKKTVVQKKKGARAPGGAQTKDCLITSG